MPRRRSLFRPVASLLTLAFALSNLGFASKRCESPVFEVFEVHGAFSLSPGEGPALSTGAPAEISFDLDEVFTRPVSSPSPRLLIRFVVAAEDGSRRSLVDLEMDAPIDAERRSLHDLGARACVCEGQVFAGDGQCFDGQQTTPAVCEAVEGTLDVPWLVRSCTADGFCVPELLLSIDVPGAPGQRLSGHLDAGIFGTLEVVPCNTGSCNTGTHACNNGNGSLT